MQYRNCIAAGCLALAIGLVPFLPAASSGPAAPRTTSPSKTAAQPVSAPSTLSGLLYGYGKGKAPIDLGLGEAAKGYATYSVELKKIYFKWLVTYGPDSQAFRSSQEETLSFWPTDVCGFGPDRLAVAGVDARGATVIEVWDLRDIPLPLPSYDASGNVNDPEITVPVIGRSVALFKDGVVGMQQVLHMCEFIGHPDTLLVQFFDSRDVYSLDTVTGSLELEITPGAGSSNVLSVPALLEDTRPEFQAMTHPTLGNVYSWSAYMTSDGTLIVRDSSKAGVLDETDFWDSSLSDHWIDLGEVTHRAR